MLYVMSDIHGCLYLFEKMLERINFNENDTLYITGDVLDRGESSVRLLSNIMNAGNIELIAGNHELDFLKVYRIITGELADTETSDEIARYEYNGGSRTLHDFWQYPEAERKQLVEYLNKCPLYKEIEIYGRKYVLVHSGIENFDKNKPLSEYTPEELTCCRIEETDSFYSDRMIICGHTPTITGSDTPARIFKGKGYINIDCGCSHPEKGGRLACVNLGSGEVLYLHD